jgi:hypothetical protein
VTHIPNATIHLHYSLRIEMEIKADYSKQVAATRASRSGKMFPLLPGQIWIESAWLKTWEKAQYPLNIQSEWMPYSTGVGEAKILRKTGVLQAPF